MGPLNGTSDSFGEKVLLLIKSHSCVVRQCLFNKLRHVHFFNQVFGAPIILVAVNFWGQRKCRLSPPQAIIKIPMK
jgi:hypothetical protein